jgi:hypothetical protein
MGPLPSADVFRICFGVRSPPFGLNYSFERSWYLCSTKCVLWAVCLNQAITLER